MTPKQLCARRIGRYLLCVAIAGVSCAEKAAVVEDTPESLLAATSKSLDLLRRAEEVDARSFLTRIKANGKLIATENVDEDLYDDLLVATFSCGVMVQGKRPPPRKPAATSAEPTPRSETTLISIGAFPGRILGLDGMFATTALSPSEQRVVRQILDGSVFPRLARTHALKLDPAGPFRGALADYDLAMKEGKRTLDAHLKAWREAPSLTGERGPDPDEAIESLFGSLEAITMMHAMETDLSGHLRRDDMQAFARAYRPWSVNPMTAHVAGLFEVVVSKQIGTKAAVDLGCFTAYDERADRLLETLRTNPKVTRKDLRQMLYPTDGRMASHYSAVRKVASRSPTMLVAMLTDTERPSVWWPVLDTFKAELAEVYAGAFDLSTRQWLWSAWKTTFGDARRRLGYYPTGEPAAPVSTIEGDGIFTVVTTGTSRYPGVTPEDAGMTDDSITTIFLGLSDDGAVVRQAQPTSPSGADLHEPGRPSRFDSHSVKLGMTDFTAQLGPVTYTDGDGRPDYYAVVVSGRLDGRMNICFIKDLKLEQVPDEFLKAPQQDAVVFAERTRRVEFRIGGTVFDYTLPEPITDEDRQGPTGLPAQ